MSNNVKGNAFPWRLVAGEVLLSLLLGKYHVVSGLLTNGVKQLRALGNGNVGNDNGDNAGPPQLSTDQG